MNWNEYENARRGGTFPLYYGKSELRLLPELGKYNLIPLKTLKEILQSSGMPFNDDPRTAP